MNPKKMALESWTLSRPKMVKALKKAGMLEEALQNAEDLAGDLISTLVSRGVPFELARERGLGMFIYLPSEKEQPRLSPGVMPLQPYDKQGAVMKKIVVIVVMAIFISITSHAQMSEKTGPAAAEISEGDSTHKSNPVLLKKYNTPEQRKTASAAAEQDSTTRPPSRMELQMNPPTETPVTFPVK